MVKASQKFDNVCIPDVTAACTAELKLLHLEDRIRPGERAAIAVGSRGITELDIIVYSTVLYLQGLNAEPFIIPAMGSHGGGTAGGQQKVLEKYGIHEASMGVPIYSSMDAVLLDTIDGVPVYLDKYADKADHIFVINRIKPHTLFHGEVESGLIKMLVIGLGKHKGALAAHKNIEFSAAGEILTKIAQKVVQKKPNIYGLGIVENGYKKISLLKALHGSQFFQEEPALLKRARNLLPGLPFIGLDLLIVDEIGKDVSGSGMDPNVVGRKWHDPNGQPHITRIFVRDLSPDTGGNATGIGRADFTTTRLVKGMDLNATYTNCLTSRVPQAARIPIHFDSDREVLRQLISTLFIQDPRDVKALWIKNTAYLSNFYMSEALVSAAEKMDNVTITGELFDLSFDKEGNLIKP